MKAKVIKTGKIINVEKYLSSDFTEDRQTKYINNNDCKIYKEKELDFEDLIDWEQRRYEIVKTAVSNLNIFDYEDNEKAAAKCIIDLADALIKELKKHNNEQD